jgi:hypothetical protein
MLHDWMGERRSMPSAFILKNAAGNVAAAHHGYISARMLRFMWAVLAFIGSVTTFLNRETEDFLLLSVLTGVYLFMSIREHLRVPRAHLELEKAIEQHDSLVHVFLAPPTKEEEE